MWWWITDVILFVLVVVLAFAVFLLVFLFVLPRVVVLAHSQVVYLARRGAS